MNFFEKIMYFLNNLEMNTPTSYGWFHILWIILTISSIIFLYKKRNNYSEKQLKIVLLTYGIVAFVLELVKQIMWAFDYDSVTNIVSWNYEWYAFPFQLCTTPIYVSLLCSFLRKSKIRTSLLSYMAFITILGSIATIIIPDSCFVSDTLVNIHTMWLHCGSLVVSIYLLITGEVKLTINNLKNAILVFLMFVGLAELLNLVIYNSGILNGETFNMFYISPYFISTLPVFDIIQEKVPYLLYLITYICIIATGGFIVYFVSYLIQIFKKLFISKKINDNKNRKQVRNNI